MNLGSFSLLTNVNNKRIHQSEISTECQADIYLQLFQLDKAGFPAQQAFELLKKMNLKIYSRIQQLQKYLKSGQTITESGVRAGILSRSDKDLLNAGEVSGTQGVIYKQLANYYSLKVKRSRKIKSQSYLPLTVTEYSY